MRVNILFTFAFVLLLAGSVCAAVAVYDDGTYEGEAAKIDFIDSTVTFDGDTATVDTSVMSTLLGQALTVSGTDLYWAGKKLTN